MSDETLARRATSFGAGADHYMRGRPGYPAEAVTWALPPDARRVLDLGAGTGAIARVLVDLGLQVLAVEPLPDMRRHIPVAARPVGGIAEAIPLRTASVDAVLVGQAFHWFARDDAVAEMSRVVRPGGTIGLLWNMLDDRVDWVSRVASLFNAEDRARLLPGANSGPHPFGRSAPLRDITERRIEHRQPSDIASLQANVASRSTVLLMSAEQRADVMHQVEQIAPAASFDVPYVCQVWRGVRL